MPFLKSHLYGKPRSKVLQELSHRHGWRPTVIIPPNDRYCGNWNLSRKNGFGRMVTRSGKLYEGNWLNNYRHNFGTSGYLSNKGEKNEIFSLEYRGNWKYGRHSGYGEKHYQDNSFFRGNFKNSMRHGFGQMWYANGSFYEGDWLRNAKHGQGLFVETNGNRFEGAWKDDMKHGRGRYYHLQSGQYQDGVWLKGNCATSIMADIPFRQSGNNPSLYPINEVKLLNQELICEDLRNDAVLKSFVESENEKSSLAQQFASYGAISFSD